MSTFRCVNNTRNRDVHTRFGGITGYFRPKLSPTEAPNPRRPRNLRRNDGYVISPRSSALARAASGCADLVRSAAQPRLGRGLHHARVTRDALSQSSRHGLTPPRRGTLREKCARSPKTRIAALGRGPDRPVDARRQPDEVAPGPHDVVLRDLRAARALRATEPSIPAFGYLFNSYYEAVGDRHPRPNAGCCRGRASTRSPRTARTSTPRCSTCDRRHGARAPRRSSSWGCTTSSSTRSCC